MASSPTTPPALPVWRTVNEAFASVLENWQAVLRICWTWALLLCPAALMQAVTFPREVTQPSAGFVVAMLVFFVVFLLASASIAVAWHRFMLRGEQPPSPYLRVGGQVPQYIGRLLLIGLIAGAIQMICSFFLFPFLAVLMPLTLDAPRSSGALVALGIFGFLVSLPTILVASRLAVALPGTAIERPMSLGDADTTMRNDVIRLDTLGGVGR